MIMSVLQYGGRLRFTGKITADRAPFVNQIIYEIQDDVLKVVVVKIGHRRDV